MSRQQSIPLARTTSRSVGGTVPLAVLVGLASIATLGFCPTAHAASPVATQDYDQIRPAVAYSAESEVYLAVWEDRVGTDSNIYARRISADGTPIGSLILVGNVDSKSRRNPSVTYNSVRDEFLAVYEYEYSSSDRDLYGRRIATTGLPVGNETPLVTPSAFDEFPAASYNSTTEEYLLVWQRRNGADEFTEWDIIGQRFDDDLAPGGIVEIATGSTDQASPAVTFGSLPLEYFVVWRQAGVGGKQDVYGQRIAGNGDLVGAAIPISTAVEDQIAPRVDYGYEENQYLVVWQDRRNGLDNGWDIYGQRVAAAGALLGGNFVISGGATPTSRANPAVVYKVQADEFVVVYEVEFSYIDIDIYSMRVASDGTLPGSEYGVSYTALNEARPAVASGRNEKYLVVWEDSRNPAPSGGIDIYAESIRLPFFSGYVYEGEFGNRTLGLVGIRVQLFCSTTAGLLGNLLDVAFTEYNGWFGLTANADCSYYNIVQTDFPGYESAAASSVGGTVVTYNWIQYATPFTTAPLDGNEFWDRPLPTETPTNTPSTTSTRTATNTATVTLTRTPTSTATDTPTRTPTRTSTNSPTITLTRTPTNTPTQTPTRTPTYTATISPTTTPTRTATATRTDTATRTTTATRTETLTRTATQTATPTRTTTGTKTGTSTRTATSTPSGTTSRTPTASATSTFTASPSVTPTQTFTLTSTPTFAGSRTPSPTATFTGTLTASPSNTATRTPTDSPTLVFTSTPTATATSSPSATLSHTSTPSRTSTPSCTASPTGTATVSPSHTSTPTTTVTSKPTPTLSASPSATIPTPLQFRGFVYEMRQFPVRTPIAGVELSLYASSDPTQLEIVLGPAVTDGNGEYRLSWDGDPSLHHYYSVVLSDARYQILDVLPGPLGYPTAQGWIQFHAPPLAAYLDNSFVVQIAPASPTPSDTPPETPTLTPTITRTRTPTATRTSSPSGTPTVTPTPSATGTGTMTPTPTATAGSPATATPTPTPTEVPVIVEVMAEFGGYVYKGTPARRQPLSDIQVDLYGSYEPDHLGTLLARAKTGTDGEFHLAHLSTEDAGYKFYDVVLSHPGVQVTDVVPGQGGAVRSLTWVGFPVPAPEAPFDTAWYLAAPPPKLAVAAVEPVPVWKGNPTVAVIQPIDFKLDGIEITQAIQCFDTTEGDPACPDNSLPLVAGKLTAVRVYISRVGTPPADPQYPAVRVDVTVVSPQAPGGPFSMSCSQQFKVPLAWNRMDETSTANFLISAPSPGQLIAWATVNADNKWPDPNPSNNQSSPAYAAVMTTRAVNIDWIRMDYHPDPSTKYAPFTGPTLADESWVMQEPLRSARWLYPTAQVNYKRRGSGIVEYGIELPVTGQSGKTELQKFKPDIRDNFTLGGKSAPAMQVFLQSELIGMASGESGKDSLFAWFPTNATSGHAIDGLAEGAPPVVPDGKGRVALSVQPMEQLMPHEVGHNFGLGHFPCAMNPQQTHPWPAPYNDCFPVEIPFNPYEMKTNLSMTFMTYGGDSISPKEWAYLLQKLQGGKGAGAAESEASVLVSGWVTSDGSGVIGPLYSVTEPPNLPELAGRAAIRFVDASEGVLATYEFAPQFQVADAAVADIAGFQFVLPAIAQAAKIELLFDDVIVSERQASEHAPTIQWLSPAPGPLLDNPTALSWRATDADDDQLSYLLSYSSNAGTTWTTLAANRTEPSYQLDAAHLAGGNSCLVRVLVSDGWHTRETTGGPFEVERKAPEVAIVMPVPGAEIEEDQALVLDGCANDPEDGALDALSWFSDRDGAVGEGATLVVPGLWLLPGRHMITATAQDDDGQEGSASVEIFVAPRCPGDCNGDMQVTVDELITLVNIALGTASVDQCRSGDLDFGAEITVDELVTAVRRALEGCVT
jgi:hypothetical protein